MYSQAFKSLAVLTLLFCQGEDTVSSARQNSLIVTQISRWGALAY